MLVAVDRAAVRRYLHRSREKAAGEGGGRSYTLFVTRTGKGRCDVTEYTRVQCLFCQTGSEKKVTELINRYGWGRAIFGEKVKVVHKGHGQEERQLLPLLPGYVFVYMGGEISGGRQTHRDYLGIDGVIRLLTYGETQQEELMGRDLVFADWLWRCGGRVEVMKAIRVGDRVEINDPLFKELQGTIVRMDRRKKSVTVKLESEAGDKFITLSYDVVQEAGAEKTPLKPD